MGEGVEKAVAVEKRQSEKSNLQKHIKLPLRQKETHTGICGAVYPHDAVLKVY